MSVEEQVPYQIRLGLTAPTDQRFRVVLADPPWRYAHARSHSRAIERQYSTLCVEQVEAMPVEALVERHALLFLWATAPLLPEALRVVAGWGFQYVTCAVWDKVLLGPGYHFRQQHELLLVGKRGTPGTPAPADRIRSVVTARRGRHSTKPVQVHEYIERAYPDARKLELFARRPRPGWSVWGNEVKSDVHLPNPAAGTFVQAVLPLGRPQP